MVHMIMIRKSSSSQLSFSIDEKNNYSGFFL